MNITFEKNVCTPLRYKYAVLFMIAEGDDSWADAARLKNGEYSIQKFLQESMKNSGRSYYFMDTKPKKAAALEDEYIKLWLFPIMNQPSFIALDKKIINTKYNLVESTQKNINGLQLRCDTYKISGNDRETYEYYFQGDRLVAAHKIYEYIDDIGYTVRSVENTWRFIYSYKPVV